MVSNIFSSTLHIRLGLPHPTAHGLFRYICGQAIDLRRIHLLHCAHGGECTTTPNADSTHVDFVFGIACSQKVVATITVQTKVVSYHDQHPKDDFISLIIEMFGCLH